MPTVALLAPGQLPEDRVDDAVRRILMLKAGLGLFDQPYVPENEEITEPTPRARELVRAAAARSTVLLKNDGTLPITPSGRVLLTGPYATSTDHLGAWTSGVGFGLRRGGCRKGVFVGPCAGPRTVGVEKKNSNTHTVLVPFWAQLATSNSWRV